MGSVIESLINHGIEICTKLRGIYSRCSGCSLHQSRSRHKTSCTDGSQLRNRCAVTSNDDGFAGLYFAKDGGELIAKFALVDNSAHGQNIAAGRG